MSSRTERALRDGTVLSEHQYRWPSDPDDRDDVRQLYKFAKSGALEPDTLSYREWGLLYRHLPEVLPDVDLGGAK